MSKKTILRICMLLILVCFCLNQLWVALAEDYQDCDNPVTPTPPGNVIYPDCWEYECGVEKPTIVATYSVDMNTIDSENHVILSATGSCPPYTWSTDSKGYSLIDNENGSMTLNVISGTCGIDYDVYATVTVADNCPTPESNKIMIRHSDGEWQVENEGSNGATLFHACGEGNDNCTYGTVEYIDGYKKWEVIFFSPTCIRHQGRPGTPGIYDYWNTLTEDEYPPCGGPWSCSLEQGSCGYHESTGLYCYCHTEKCIYYEWSCQIEYP